jgi:5-methylthioadenosine/S-adenosylhomocysteine deaminase
MEKIDHLIHAKHIITCEDNNRVLENHSLAIKDGKILALLPSQEAKQKYQSASEHDYSSHAVLPGFINSHTHIAMNVLRGYADDLELLDWLQNYIWPAEGKLVSAEMVADGSLLAMGEMIRCGTTCFNDMYFYPEQTAMAAERAGMRAHIGMHIMNVPNGWAKSIDECFEKSEIFYQQYRNHPLVTPTFAPHSTYTVPEKTLIRIKELAEKYDLKINIHCQESAGDVEGGMRLNNKRPLQCLYDIGLVSPRLIAMHMTQLDEHDFEMLAEGKPNVVHCPESNMKLSSGICPVEKLLGLGVNMALGTDGAVSNNDLDMIGEMRTAAFLGKISTRDPKAVSAETALKMATINGAKALGIDHYTGSLTPGKAADFIAIDLNQLETQPLFHPVSQIVYAAARTQVTDVWVNGKQLLKNRQLLTLDEKELLNKAQTWRKKI